MNIASTPPPAALSLRLQRLALGFVFLWFFIGGIAHFAATRLEMSIVPPYIPWPHLTVLATGALELLGAAALLLRPVRRVAGVGLFALTIAVTPANIYMLQHPELFAVPYWALIARLPLQIALLALIWWASTLGGARWRHIAAAVDRHASWLYFIVGQAGWYACVLSAARHVAWIGECIAVVLVGAHLLRVERARQELKLIVLVMLIGWSWESVLRDLGLLAYPTSGAMAGQWGLAPLWLPALWALFAAQINTTYAWLKRRVGAAVLLGAIAGPVSFRAGAALGALRFEKPWPAALALAAGWALLLPLTMVLARRWDGAARL